MKYRCYLKKEDEKKLPIKVQKELKFLRDTIKELNDRDLYNSYCIDDDPIPLRLIKKYESNRG